MAVGTRWFCQWLEESSLDFRVGSEALHKLSYGVFGSGNSLYEDNYNKVRSGCLSTCLKQLDMYTQKPDPAE